MEKSSFFNSVNGDRKYKAEDFAEFFNSLVTNGVFPNPSTNLQVTANNNMTVTLKSGKAWINGHVYINTDDLVLTIDVADGVLNRIDRLVLRLDTVNREIKAQVKKGTFASSPVSPTLQRDADGFELGIADVYVGKGTVSIVQANITDLRMNTGLCGWVNSLIQADTTAIFNQYLNWYQTTTGKYEQDINTIKTQFQQEFDTWFATIKDTLSGDVAGNLLNKVNALETNLSTANTNITNVTNDLATYKADKASHFKYIGAIGNGQEITDFNTATTQGYYTMCDLSSGTLNYPPLAYSWGILEVIVDEDTKYMHQKAYSIVDGVNYERVRNESTTWTPWRKILDQRDYDNLFQYANDIKTKWANAVTLKGVSASPTETSDSLATKTGQISAGKASGTISSQYINAQQSKDFVINSFNFNASMIYTTVNVSYLSGEQQSNLSYMYRNGVWIKPETTIEQDIADNISYRSYLEMQIVSISQTSFTIRVTNKHSTSNIYLSPIYWYAWEV